MPAITFLPLTGLTAATITLDSITFLTLAGLTKATAALSLARRPGTTILRKAVPRATTHCKAAPTVPNIAGFEDSTVVNP